MDELDDEVWITQFVFADADADPVNVPRPARDHDGLSVIQGVLDTPGAAKYVRFQVHIPYEGDGVRHAQVSNLRAAGFVVKRTPTRRNPIHVSVSTEAEWDAECGQRFDQCFGAVTRYNDPGGR